MAIAEVRAAIITTIQAEVPGLKTVAAHRGQFDSTTEIKRYANLSPTVLVACMGFDLPAQSGGLLRLPVRWAICILTRDTPGYSRDVAALAIGEALAALIGRSVWGRDDVSAAGNVTATNLVQTEIDTQAIGLWSLAWQQLLTVGATDLATLNDWLIFHQDTDRYPPDGQIDISQTTDLPQ